ncbi:TIGR03773 family transporter-associated surface protein [Streptomyces sp. NPDC047453]|uniref:TIGR03773 family transporter-associated surface protein n=1 Tax=Streptomyces sp. NPDC047453 TaxID=3154812 RepID=UPI00340FAC25
MRDTRRMRVAVTVALAATLVGGGTAVAEARDDAGPGLERSGQDDSPMGGSEPGRIGYADGVLSLDCPVDAAPDEHRAPDGDMNGGAALDGEARAAHVLRVPDIQVADGPAPGWDTTQVPDGTVDRDTVRWSLTGLDGPGDLRIRSVENPHTVLFDSADGLPDGYDLPVGGRGVTRWEFTAKGTYRPSFTAEARTVDGRDLSVEAVCTVLVGDEAIARADGEGGTTPEDRTPGGRGIPQGDASTAEPVATAPRYAHQLVTLLDASPQSPGPALAARTADTGKASARETDSSTSSVISTKKVIDQGHIDFAARVVDKQLRLHIKDGTEAGRTVWREPSSVVLHVKPEAKKTLPDSKAFAFLGKPGDQVWLLDQVQQPGLLWPGWSTDNLDAGATKGGVTFSLTRVEGPGAFALYTFDAMSGATVLLNSKAGGPDSFDVAPNTHAHGGWAFTKEGTYRLTLRISGKLTNGTPVSDTRTVAFVVGGGDPNAVEPGSGSGGDGASSGAGTDGSNGPSGSGGSGGSGGSSHGSGSGSGGGSSAGGQSPGGGGSMASTGAGQTALAGGAAAASAALGTALVVLTRRRRRGTPAEEDGDA